MTYLSSLFFFNLLPGKPKKSTYGMLDLGGASMQASFELEDVEDNVEYMREFSLNADSGNENTGKRFNYKVFLRSFLNYGANSMRKR